MEHHIHEWEDSILELLFLLQITVYCCASQYPQGIFKVPLILNS